MAREKGVLYWLNAYPLKEYDFDLNQQQFWDGISIRQGCSLSNLPRTCECGSKYDFQESMSCRKGGFMQFRKKGKKYARTLKLRLIPLTGEQLKYGS